MTFGSQKSYLYWSALIQEWEESELTQSDFCAQKKVNLGTFCKWRARIKIEKQREEQVRLEPETKFLEATLIDSDVQAIESIVLHLKEGHQLHVPSSLNKSSLHDLFSSLGVIK